MDLGTEVLTALAQDLVCRLIERFLLRSMAMTEPERARLRKISGH
jgi:hypothetical protein